MKLGFDNEKYLTMQAEHIRQRRAQFGGKLYLEFGGKLFDDHHASRVLPGFQPDSKIRMLGTMKDEVEIVVAICAGDIEKSKMRGDLGISYDEDVLRLIDVFRSLGFYVGSVVITQYAGQPNAEAFIKRLESLGVKIPLRDIPPTWPTWCPTRVWAATSTSRPAAAWWWSPRPAPAAAKWPPA